MGPLDGVRVIEMVGLGPGPFGAMVLADHGADVVCVEAPTARGVPGVLDRGKRQLVLDVKNADDVTTLLSLVERADVFIEPWRPGVAERAGLGPDRLRALNPRIVYVRMTGWGQTGPLAPRAGHDITYIALAGALGLMGPATQAPTAPPALLGDMAGGLVMVTGVLAALYERERSGEGQVVDAAMVDGAALLTTAFHGLRATGAWQEGRGVNLVDGGSFYDTYETADGRYVAVGPLEPQFFTLLVGLLGVDVTAMPPYQDPQGWPAWKTLLGQEFKRRSRDEWVQLFEGTDACVAPVLSPWEAPLHPHNAARGTFVDVDGIRQPAPAPRFDRTPAGVPRPLRHHGRDCDAVLADWSVPEACAR